MILTGQERRLSLHCNAGEMEEFTSEDVTNGIKEFLKKNFVSDEVSVGTNIDFACTSYERPEIILNISGQLPLPVSPISGNESKTQRFSQE